MWCSVGIIVVLLWLTAAAEAKPTNHNLILVPKRDNSWWTKRSRDETRSESIPNILAISSKRDNSWWTKRSEIEHQLGNAPNNFAKRDNSWWTKRSLTRPCLEIAYKRLSPFTKKSDNSWWTKRSYIQTSRF